MIKKFTCQRALVIIIMHYVLLLCRFHSWSSEAGRAGRTEQILADHSCRQVLPSMRNCSPWPQGLLLPHVWPLVICVKFLVKCFLCKIGGQNWSFAFEEVPVSPCFSILVCWSSGVIVNKLQNLVSLSTTWSMAYYYGELFSLAMIMTIANTYFAYLLRDGKAELAWVDG